MAIEKIEKCVDAIVVTGSTTIQARGDDGQDVHRAVEFRAKLSLLGLDRLIHRAAGNKSRHSMDGPLRVWITAEHPVTPISKGARTS